jgi:hypothetical protein
MALPAKFLRTFFSAILFTTVGTGCLKNIPHQGPGRDPDTNSGLDARRGGARLIYINRAETDSVSWPRLLRTKWKRIDINVPGVQNILDCELRIDNTGADVNIDVFNSLGTQIGFSPGPAPNKLKKLGVQLDEFGTYFIRLQAAQPRDESDLSVLCEWEEQAAPPEPAPVKVKKGPLPPKPPVTAGHGEKGTEGRIMQSFREGDKTILHLDKGSDAGVRQDTEGIVLAGKSGREPLAGGNIRIVKVIDGTRSVAESTVKSIGRNNRMVLFLKSK